MQMTRFWREKKKHTALTKPCSDYNRTELGMCSFVDICTLCNSHEAMSIKMTITPSTESAFVPSKEITFVVRLNIRLHSDGL